MRHNCAAPPFATSLPSHAAACNIGLLLRHQTGIGTPRSLQGRALSAICRLIDALIDRGGV